MQKDHIGHEVKILSNLIKRHMNASVETHNLKELTGMQSMIIQYMYYNKDKNIFQRDIEKKFDVRRSTATGILQLMEKQGYIIREEVDFDGRLKRLKLTSKALDIHRIIQKNIEEFEAQLRRGLSKEEVDLFLTLIRKIRSNIE